LDAGLEFLFWAANTPVAASPRIIADTKINLFIVYLRKCLLMRFFYLLPLIQISRCGILDPE